ncbi:4a-hydroxytetrahydrobiopterin dehydratase [Salirhabdus euzebyi]|uniref:4a-hydroxytetrahydrobiopterin dehydratase n=1 Tax=Salirhabdus euzebyi TaxID=394506 RepID=A0A841Q6F8_9BACI|nr:4a-hydroxytetrahydrobiopterin dehydratase [Salirhabdus euzebyi]MBB6454099.1 4a-hydroxytetrahydrobiopterin dehydratase [Salirhabdus euzebyi]
MERLAKEALAEELEYLSGWSIEDERWLVKRYRFTEFPTGIQFVNQIAELAEEVDHHPFINIEYKVVTIKLTSWRAKGLTDLDMKLAQNYDSIFLQVTE